MSAHAAAAASHPARVRRLHAPALLAALALLAAFALALIRGELRLFLAAWLAAWWFCLGIVLGAAANARIQSLTGGRWGRALAPAQDALQRTLPAVLLLSAPLLWAMFSGHAVLWPWSGASRDWSAGRDHPGFALAWFAPAFVATRLALYAACWWLLCAAPHAPRRAGRAAFELAAWTLLTSLAAVDLTMSLMPGWSSTVYGWLALMNQLLAGAAAAVALATLDAAHAPSPAPHAPPIWRDLGNLLLAWLLLAAYLEFMQWLVIWSENLPREIRWYLPRVDTGWRHAGLALVLLQFALPGAALLWRRVKDAPARLRAVACTLLAAQALHAAWLVVPSVEPHARAAWGWLPAVFAAMALLLFGHLPARLAAQRTETTR